MDTIRDPARVDPWRESLERSLARRGKRAPSSLDSGQLRPAPPPARPDTVQAEIPGYWLLCWRAVVKRWLVLVASASGILTLALLAATRPSVSDGRDVQGSAARAHVGGARAGLPSVAGHTPSGLLPGRAGAAGSSSATCVLTTRAIGYVNPLAGATVVPKRIDQGVDYAGSGVLTAIGGARITLIALGDTGWPGAFIEYQLLDGPAAGCYVYYAEGVTPAEGLYVGETLRAGQAIASLIPDYVSGIEIGWAAGDGTKSYAAQTGDWSSTNEQDNIPTVAGAHFSALIASLGGPAGKVKGRNDRSR